MKIKKLATVGLSLIFLFNFQIALASTNGLVINEIMVGSEDGGANKEFIELYNSSSQAIDLAGYNLKKKTSSGTEDNLVSSSYFEGIIGPSDYFLITPQDWLGFFGADLTYSGSSYSIADDNTVLLYDAEGALIDKVGYGEASDFEANPAINPINDQSISRSGGVDTDNNADDFTILTTPTPTASSYDIEPYCGDGNIDVGEGCDDGNNNDGDGCSANCEIEFLSFCGDGTIDDGEECDDGNNVDGDGCDSSCHLEIEFELAESGIVINEFVSKGDEWIELYNVSEINIDLSGWTIEDNTGEEYGSGLRVYDLDDLTILSGGFLVLDKGEEFSFAINDGGDILILKNGAGEIVDQVVFGDGADTIDENNADVPGEDQALARNPDGVDTDVYNVDFSVTTELTPGLNNEIVAPRENISNGRVVYIDVDDGSAVVENIEEATQSASPSDVVINELVSDPNDDLDEDEWVELYNNTDQAISLNNWTIEDGSEKTTPLSGNIASRGFYIIDAPKGKLNNTGDTLILRDADGQIIDQVTYGSWEDDDISDNAPLAKSPKSIFRKIDGQDTDNDYLDFVAGIPTKNLANEFIEVKISDYTLRINEALPNPEGPDNESEFIELYNFGSTEIDLSGFKLGDGSSRRYTIEGVVIAAGGYVVFYRSQTGIALNNSGQEQIILIDPSGVEIEVIQYSGSVEDDVSWAYFENNYSWTSVATPGEVNILQQENKKPKARAEFIEDILVNQEIVFDASDSFDPEGENLEYIWRLSDEIIGNESILKHMFDASGKYQMQLEVIDNAGLNDILELNFVVSGDSDKEKTISLSASSGLYISEVLPDPEGSDIEGEWIEICAESDASLIGWQIDDIEGGSRPYLIEDDISLRAGECFVFDRPTTGIALNNSDESVRLIDPSGKVIDEVYYDKAFVGLSYAIDSSKHWFWASVPSPGVVNPSSLNRVLDSDNLEILSDNILERVVLSEIKNLPLNTLVRTSGIVSVEPGILGSQIFYLAGSGIQVYMYAKDFPEIELGDYIEVVGALAESGGEKRIKLKEKSDIVILEKNKQLPEAHQISIDQINEDFEGSLISFEGDLIEKSGASLYIDDGTEEVRVYLKSTANIDLPKLKEGEKMRITGILSETQGGYRVLPRYTSDIEILTPVSDDLTADIAKISQVEASGRQENLVEYLIITIVVLFTALITSMINNYMIRRQNSIDN